MGFDEQSRSSDTAQLILYLSLGGSKLSSSQMIELSEGAEFLTCAIPQKAGPKTGANFANSLNWRDERGTDNTVGVG